MPKSGSNAMWSVIAEWLLKAVSPVAVAGGVAYAWRLVTRRRAAERARAAYVEGLPFECKCVLMEFVAKGNRVQLPSWNQWVEILENDRVIRRHSSAGGFDAASYIFAIDDGMLAFLKRRPPVKPPEVSK